MAGLARLKPFFDRKYGRVTPGNSSQITDGAAWLLLASAAAVEKWQLQPLGRITDSQWAGLDPAADGPRPGACGNADPAAPAVRARTSTSGKSTKPFAAQVLGCVAAWESDDYCREQLGLPGALGSLAPDRLNVDGGAIALGHPVGASGARIVLHLLHALRAARARRGIAAICIGGGQGGAMLVETIA
jgi:acetyl-CoA C-acetyltransferase